MAVIDFLEAPERRLGPGAKLSVIDRADELPARPARAEAELLEPLEGQQLIGEQADHRAGVVAPLAAGDGLGPGVVRLGTDPGGKVLDPRRRPGSPDRPVRILDAR